MHKNPNGKVVVLGGYGTFGRLISEQLASSANVVIAGRDREMGQQFADSIKADHVLCDAKDKKSLQKAVSGALVVINASGPFLPKHYSIPQTCIEENCHYIDLADDREYVTEFKHLNELARKRGVFACAGASTTPAVTHALVSELISRFRNTHSIKIYLTAGNKNEPGVSTFESILSYAGRPIQVWSNSKWKKFFGWGLSEIFEFPDPVGKRFVQLCNVPDLELFPTLFEADEVIFKAGVELPIFNLGLSVLAQVKKFIPPINLPVLAKPVVKISRLFRKLGSFSGGVLVVLQDESGKKESLAFVTSENGPRIPASPAVLLTRKMLRTGPPAHGAFPCVGFVSLEEFRSYLEPFGIELIQK
jgi:hypothetical protein